jgi:uncharacterized protein YecT (DUF1311 family)
MHLRLLPLLMLPLVAPAAAQPDPHRPTAQERAWLESCLRQAAAAPSAPGRRDSCGFRLTGARMGREADERPAPVRQPPGRIDHPRSCAPIETALWDEWLNRWYREALAALPEPARESLGRAQRAWIAFRDAACGFETELSPGFLGQDMAATCRLEQTVARALDLRRIGEDAVANRRGSEGPHGPARPGAALAPTLRRLAVTCAGALKARGERRLLPHAGRPRAIPREG